MPKHKTVHGRSLQAWRQYFATVAKECSAEARNLPKGQRRAAYLQCVSAKLRAYKP